MFQRSRAAVTILPIFILLTSFCLADVGKTGTISVDHRFHDFGYVPMDYRFVHIFVISNTGQGDLLIEKITSNCDCTSANIADTLLKPGDSTELRILFHTRDYYGLTNRKITIYSNDPEHPELELTHSSNIGIFSKEYLVRPVSVFFLPKSSGKDITLINITKNEITYDLEISRDSLYTLNKHSGKISGGQGQLIHVQPREDTKKGTFYSSLTVIFHSEPETRITVPVKIVSY